MEAERAKKDNKILFNVIQDNKIKKQALILIKLMQ